MTGIAVSLLGTICAGLLLAVFLDMSLPGFLRMVSSVVGMPTCGMGVVRSLLALPTLMMLRGFAVVASGVAQMLRCLLVVPLLS